MMSLWDALRMNMMISYQELVRTFLSAFLVTRLNIKQPAALLIAHGQPVYKHEKTMVTVPVA
ncbi:GhoT/OrtT family toxin [Klebsiella pneumoniae]